MQEFVRGDTFAFKFKLTIQDKVAIQKEDIDTLFITCRRYASKEFPVVFEKTLDDVEIDDNGYCHAKFEPKDTEKLAYGSYFFDIEVTLKNGYRKTKLFQFKITKETTIHESGDVDGA